MKTLSFTYKNHNGITSVRTLDAESIDYRKSPGYDYEPGWFVTGYCHDRKAIRSFALNNIVIPEGDRDYELVELFNS